MVLSSQALSLRLLHNNQEVCTLEDPREERKGGRGRGKGGRKGRREGGREEGRIYIACLVPRLPQPSSIVPAKQAQVLLELSFHYLMVK